MSAPCRVCGRQLDDCGTCVCGKPQAADEVTLHLGGARTPVACVCKCGLSFMHVPGITDSPTCCYFCTKAKRREREALAKEAR